MKKVEREKVYLQERIIEAKNLKKVFLKRSPFVIIKLIL